MPFVFYIPFFFSSSNKAVNFEIKISISLGVSSGFITRCLLLFTWSAYRDWTSLNWNNELFPAASFLVRPFKARNCLKLLEGEKEERTNERKKERRPQAMRMNEDGGKFAWKLFIVFRPRSTARFMNTQHSQKAKRNSLILLWSFSSGALKFSFLAAPSWINNVKICRGEKSIERNKLWASPKARELCSEIIKSLETSTAKRPRAKRWGAMCESYQFWWLLLAFEIFPRGSLHRSHSLRSLEAGESLKRHFVLL